MYGSSQSARRRNSLHDVRQRGSSLQSVDNYRNSFSGTSRTSSSLQSRDDYHSSSRNVGQHGSSLQSAHCRDLFPFSSSNSGIERRRELKEADSYKYKRFGDDDYRQSSTNDKYLNRPNSSNDTIRVGGIKWRVESKEADNHRKRPRYDYHNHGQSSTNDKYRGRSNSSNNRDLSRSHIPISRIRQCRALKEYDNIWKEIKGSRSVGKIFKKISVKNISLTVNAFSKCDQKCRNQLSFYQDLKLHYKSFISKDMLLIDMAMLANGFSKFQDVEQFKDAFDKFNQYEDYSSFEPQAIAMLANGFSKFANLKQFDHFWQKILSFYDENNIKKLNLQDISTILYSMRRLVRTDAVVRKLYINAVSHIVSLIGNNLSKDNALDLYMLFACYSSSFSYFKGKTRDSISDLKDQLAISLKSFISDLDSAKLNWNNIIDMEAWEADGAIDKIIEDYLSKSVDKIGQHECSSNKFSLAKVIEGFNTPMVGNSNIVEVDKITISGNFVQSYPQEYSIFARLTEGKIPYVKVTLPGKVSPFTLDKVVDYKGEKYRLDLFGGSAMKGNYREKTSGSLVGINVKDSMPESDFTKQIQSNFFTFKESFYYFQRAMLPSIKATDVLEGKFKVGIFPDIEGDSHKFIIRDSGGDIIKIKVHNGCGFIKKSLYDKFSGEDSKVFGENKGRLSYQCLQHYKATDKVVQELREGALPTLDKELTKFQTADKDLIFDCLSNGNVKGELGIAIASSDDKVYLPKKVNHNTNSDRYSIAKRGVLIARSPYISKSSIVAVPEDQISQGSDSATSRYISEISAIQYSLTGKLKSRLNSNAAKANECKECYSFFKGISIVISDKDWPKDYEDLDIVFSSEDQKLCSTWMESKNKISEESLGDFSGILAATSYYSKGSFVALPTKLQKGLGGDYDGDHNLIISKEEYPCLYELISQNQGKRARGNKENLVIKPTKTFTPAIIEGKYVHSRVNQIRSTKLNILEDCTVLMAVYKLQSKNKKKALNEKCMSIIDDRFSYEDESKKAFYQDLKRQFKHLSLKQLLVKGIYEGTDVYKRNGHAEGYRIMCNLLKEAFCEEGINLSIPYGNNLKRKLFDNSTNDAEKFITSVQEVLEPYKREGKKNIALAVMEELISKIQAEEMSSPVSPSFERELPMQCLSVSEENKPGTALSGEITSNQSPKARTPGHH